MGVEIVFILIYPVALICMGAAFWFWFAVVKATQSTALEYIRGFMPLAVGFAASLAGVTFLTYIERSADFTTLVQRGYYSEADRSIYLPGRIMGELTLNLVFMLPLICLVIVPSTTRLISKDKLGFKWAGSLVIAVYIVISFLSWVLGQAIIVPPYSLLEVMQSNLWPILVSALPIPFAAILLFPRKHPGGR